MVVKRVAFKNVLYPQFYSRTVTSLLLQGDSSCSWRFWQSCLLVLCWCSFFFFFLCIYGSWHDSTNVAALPPPAVGVWTRITAVAHSNISLSLEESSWIMRRTFGQINYSGPKHYLCTSKWCIGVLGTRLLYISVTTELDVRLCCLWSPDEKHPALLTNEKTAGHMTTLHYHGAATMTTPHCGGSVSFAH